MGPALSISLYYLALFAALGFYWPYLTLYLAGLGLPSGEITRLAALGPLMGALVPVAAGLLADARTARVWILRGASIAAIAAFGALLAVGTGRLALYVVFALFALCRAPLTALVDATAVEEARLRGGSYGRLRLCGSLGFFGAVATGGALYDAAGYRAVIVATIVALAAAAASAFALPAPPTERRTNVLRDWAALLRAPDVPLFLAAILLAQIACSAYDGCYSLHLARLGFDGRFVGAAWAVGVGAEVLLLAASGRLLAWLGAERMLAIATAVAAARWLAIGHLSSGAAILALQPLHGITFGFYWVAGVSIVRARATADSATAAQGLLAATASLGTVLGLFGAGTLFDRFGGGALFTVAAIAAAAAFVASARFAATSGRQRTPVREAVAG